MVPVIVGGCDRDVVSENDRALGGRPVQSGTLDHTGIRTEYYEDLLHICARL